MAKEMLKVVWSDFLMETDLPALLMVVGTMWNGLWNPLWPSLLWAYLLTYITADLIMYIASLNMTLEYS